MPEQKPDVERISLRMESIWMDAELRIMQDIVRRIKKNRKITSTADYQINRLIDFGKSTEEIERILKEALDATYPEMYELYDAVINWQYVRNAEIYEQINGRFLPPEENEWMKQVSEAVVKQTSDELKNISQSYGFTVMMGNKRVFTPFAEYYQKYVDAAIMDIVSGGFDYNTVIRRVVTQMTNSGLRTVDYASGHSNRTPVAVRRAVLTGLAQVTGKISERNAALLETDHYEVDWHAGARPDHRVWQGKVYTYKQLQTVCGLGTVTGLHGANCYHDYYPFFPGISERNWSDEWLKEQNRKEAETKEWNGKEYDAYGRTQKQRQMETAMRAQREKVSLLKESGADQDEITIARCKYQAQLNEYSRFCKKMGLKEQRERIYYDMRGRVATNTKKQNAQYTSEMIKNADKDSKEYKKYQNILSDTDINLAKFRQLKYNDPKRYWLLQGYARAVDKGDIHVLTGFGLYEKTAADVDKELVGITTSDGIKISSYTTHFIDRVIGQTSTSHEGMRLGTPINDVKDALQNPVRVGEIKTVKDTDTRQKYYGERASVVISTRDNRIIQATPQKGE